MDGCMCRWISVCHGGSLLVFDQRNMEKPLNRIPGIRMHFFLDMAHDNEHIQDGVMALISTR
jgi:hypothetical protein